MPFAEARSLLPSRQSRSRLRSFLTGADAGNQAPRPCAPRHDRRRRPSTSVPNPASEIMIRGEGTWGLCKQRAREREREGMGERSFHLRGFEGGGGQTSSRGPVANLVEEELESLTNFVTRRSFVSLCLAVVATRRCLATLSRHQRL